MTETALAAGADELLRGAYEANYRFPPGFAGFRSLLRFSGLVDIELPGPTCAGSGTSSGRWPAIASTATTTTRTARKTSGSSTTRTHSAAW